MFCGKSKVEKAGNCDFVFFFGAKEMAGQTKLSERLDGTEKACYNYKEFLIKLYCRIALFARSASERLKVNFMEKNKEVREISLSSFWAVFKKCWYWMLIAAILLGAVAYVYTDRFVQKKYASHVSYIINVDVAGENSFSDIRNDIVVRAAAIDTIIQVLETSNAKKQFVARLADEGFDVFSKDANGNDVLRGDILSSVGISAKPKSGTHEDLIFSLDVTTRANSPEMAKALAECITDHFNAIWREIVSVDDENSALANYYLSELERPSGASLYEPNVTTSAIFAALIGMIAVYVAFFLYAFFRRVLVSEEDLFEATGVPVLAAVPRIHGSRARKHKEGEVPSIGSDKLISDEKRSFAAVEAYRHLRTNLIYSRHIEGTPIYGVVSAMPHEGKSLSSANLAISFAQIGKKTVIVDCDLRRGTQYEIFGFSDETEGLTEYLAGLHETPALRESNVENLFVLTSGNLSPDPTGLLHSARFDTLISYLSENFDCVIFDLPPIRIVSDALILSDRISGYILVAQSGVSYDRDVRESAAALHAVGATIFGTVLNGFNLKVGKNRRGFGNSYYYNYNNSAYYTNYSKASKASDAKKQK